jgi:preprotein translocase subunit SecE
VERGAMKEWIEKIRRFMTEVSVELKRTTWPSRMEVRGTTLVVIVTVFIFAVFLFVVDWFLSQGVTKVFDYFK